MGSRDNRLSQLRSSSAAARVWKWMGARAALACVTLACATAAWASGPVVSFHTLPALQVQTPIPGSTRVPGDFNGDGTSDLLWFNPSETTLGYWLMQAGVPTQFDLAVSRIGIRSYKITPGYFVGAVGDLDGDGFADLVFTSSAHDLWLWTNRHHGTFASRRIYDYPSGWQLIGAGDINGDGRDDLLWLDEDTSQFGYWLMDGHTRIGSRVFGIAPGYYPIGLGYYTPSNRLSILWTSAAKDLYVWDSQGNGFRSYNLSPYVDLDGAWAVGGGFMGTYIGVEHVLYDTDGRAYAGSGDVFSRIFDARGNQTGVEPVPAGWSGGSAVDPASGGYIIKGGTTHFTGLYVLDRHAPIIGAAGVSMTPAGGDSGTAPAPDDLRQWTYPEGWFVVGSPASTSSASAPPAAIIGSRQ
jgi:hypothetical protein